MGKNDFDIDFDFEEEYGFDPKSFLGAEEYDKDIDLNAFSDEELGLTSRETSEDEAQTAAGEQDSFDLDEDWDADDFLNMGSMEEEPTEEDPEEEWEDEPEEPQEEQDDFQEDALEAEEAEFQPETDLPEDTEPEEIAMNEEMEYAEEAELEEQPVFEEEILEEDPAEDPAAEESGAKKKRPRKEHKPVQMPKIHLPKLKTPNIFTKFFDLYFAPVLHKELREQPQDPNNPRRRRRKSKQQIFKEIYLPPIIVCICLILVLSMVIGSLSNAISLKKIEDAQKQSQLKESISAAEQAQQQSQVVLEEAAKLAAGYNYDDAITMLDSMGDLTQYPDLAAKRAEYATAMTQLVEIKDVTSIPNLSFHVLIHDMARAQKDTDDLKGNYNKNFVTTGEFSKILTDLYNNGYVLVDFDSFVAANTDLDGNEVFFSDSIWLPSDKKPVMITETMVNYFAYMVDGDKDGVADAKGDGFASKLVIDANGDIKAEYVDEQGQTSVGNYDLVPILEDFIKQHPDFSYRGARATLAVTGDEGVFGYRTNTAVVASKGQDYFDQQVAGAKEVVQKLRDLGYNIACYTYENKAYGKLSVQQIQADLQSWAQQVTPVIGAVDTFVFAKVSNISDYTGNAFKVMYDSGFRYFIAHGNQPYTEVNSTYVRQNRLMVTGENMQWYRDQFNGLFDCAAILEVNTRGEVPKSS